MDGTLACHAGSRGSIPAVGSQQKIVYSNGFSPSWVRKKLDPDRKQIKTEILAAPSVGEHGNKCEVWVAKKKIGYCQTH